jgi:HTH-type transcriptional regulator/antitoxin HigA
MNVRALHHQADYEWAIQEVARYFENEPALGSKDGDRFEVLTTLIKVYEEQNFPVPDADPIEVLHFAIESMGRTQADLARIIGRSRASEVLNRRRPLTLDMIRDNSAAWKLPMELLTGAYELKRE